MPLTGPDVALYEKRGHVGIITMNRPERMNALGGGLPERIQEHWNAVNEDDDVWAAILTGTGRAFCAGADLKAMNESGRPAGSGSMVATGPTKGAAVPTWKPTIAAVNGWALAGGWSQAMSCDVRLAAESAQFGITEVKWNLPAGFGARLEYFISIGLANEVLLWGQFHTAQRMYEIGFVNKVVPDDQLMEEAMRWAELVCKNGPASVRAHKQMVYAGRDMGVGELAQFGNALFRPIALMEDSKEGPKAFVEKRSPEWKLR
jgi:enoyl-CoA hydratase